MKSKNIASRKEPTKSFVENRHFSLQPPKKNSVTKTVQVETRNISPNNPFSLQPPTLQLITESIQAIPIQQEPAPTTTNVAPEFLQSGGKPTENVSPSNPFSLQPPTLQLITESIQAITVQQKSAPTTTNVAPEFLQSGGKPTKNVSPNSPFSLQPPTLQLITESTQFTSTEKGPALKAFTDRMTTKKKLIIKTTTDNLEVENKIF